MAGYLTLPYIAWLGYAAALNYDIWIKNAQGSAVDHARKLGKDVENTACHTKNNLKREANQAREDAKDAARIANKNAKNAVDDASDRFGP